MKKTFLSIVLLAGALTGPAQTVGVDQMQERFLRYVAVESQSIPTDDPRSFPISEGEKEMARLLQTELSAMGVECTVSSDYYVYVRIPSNQKNSVPVLGFSVHTDYTPEANATGIKPRIIKNYDGKAIRLNDRIVLSADAPEGKHLKACIGHTLIVTDGTTILGGDCKAGCAILVELIQSLTRAGNKIRHGEIQLVFAPREDCGDAAKRIDTQRFNPDIYYDVDGGEVGSVLSSNFSAERVNLKFIGKAAHPSEAKQLGYGDALACASRFVASFPLDVNPANSEDRQGYIHFYQMDREGDDYSLYTRVRYFSKEEGSLFNRMIDRAIAQAETDFPHVKIEIMARDRQYENVEPTLHPEAINIVTAATRKAGITPSVMPVRAGTTAAMMAARGLKGGCCIGSAQNNDHTIYEYVSIDDMCKVHEIVLNIVEEVSRL